MHFHKIEVQSKISNGISSSETVILKFSLTESTTLLKWEHSKEFEYHNQMFDVVEAIVVGDSVVYLCYPDTKETRIKNQISDITNSLIGNNQKQTEKEKMLDRFFKNLFFKDILNYTYFEKWTQSYPLDGIEKPVLFCTSPPKPPPKVGIVINSNLDEVF